jgi:hypothetical protein
MPTLLSIWRSTTVRFANPANTALLSALGLVDASLGRAQEAIEEAKRAEGMLPIFADF